MKDRFQKEIGKQLADDFGLWTFGEGFQDKQTLELMQRWNDMHRESVRLESNETIDSSAVKMVDLWIKSKLKS